MSLLTTSKFGSTPPRVSAEELLVAEKPKRLVLDKKGFFVILPNKEENRIYVEYYANSGKRLRTIVGEDASSLCSTIIAHGFVSKLDHAAYLGRELSRAELFLKYDIPFVQDKAPGRIKQRRRSRSNGSHG